MAVNTWTAGTTTGAQMATEFNKVANALNTLGQYSHAASVALTTTPSALPMNTNNFQSGSVTHSTTVNNTRIVAVIDGEFIFTMQPQATHLTTGTGSCTFWLRKNGTTPVSDSSIFFRLSGVIGSAPVIITCPIVLAPNEYIEVMAVATANSEHEVTYIAGSGSGATAIPNTNSLVVTVTQLPL